MDYFENLDLVKRLGNEIMRPRPYCYSEEVVGTVQFDSAEYLRQYPDIEYQSLHLSNEAGDRLKTSLFVRGEPTDICIVFMHGLGSMRLEGLSLLRQLPRGYSLCVFDFSGCGKSEGMSVTYGMKEKHDICTNTIFVESVLNMLRFRYSRFVLWGRSMGAVSALLHATTYNNPSDVIMLILDSPFSSFQAISRELAVRKIKVPAFMVNVVLDLVKANFSKLSNNPFLINLSDCSNCLIPSLFVYSNNDDVVSAEHTHTILANYKGKYDKLQIQQNHNSQRTRQTLRKIFNSIEVCLQNDALNSTNTSIKVKRKNIFNSTRDLSEKKGRGINVLSRQKSVRSQHHRDITMKSCIPNLITMNQYFPQSAQIEKKPTRKRKTPPKRMVSSCFQNEITTSLADKIANKLLSNKRYL